MTILANETISERITGNPEVTPVGLVPRNALVVIDEWLADYQRAGETGTVEAQLDIIWPTTGTPNRCHRKTAVFE
jgi:hypothetical protein